MIYVDELQLYINVIDPKTTRWGKKWCHMWTNGDVEDLHRFAEKIGLKREYFQDKPRFPHYDLIPSRRRAAINYGAQVMSLKDWFNFDRYKK